MSRWETRWSGCWPCHCHGEWTLLKDGVEVETEIPFQKEPAETQGTYSQWYFDSSFREQYEDYEDGIGAEEWCEKHSGWLETIAPKSEWQDIYEAFRTNDWRYGSCGGCV